MHFYFAMRGLAVRLCSVDGSKTRMEWNLRMILGNGQSPRVKKRKWRSGEVQPPPDNSALLLNTNVEVTRVQTLSWNLSSSVVMCRVSEKHICQTSFVMYLTSTASWLPQPSDQSAQTSQGKIWTGCLITCYKANLKNGFTVITMLL